MAQGRAQMLVALVGKVEISMLTETPSTKAHQGMLEMISIRCNGRGRGQKANPSRAAGWDRVWQRGVEDDPEMALAASQAPRAQLSGNNRRRRCRDGDSCSRSISSRRRVTRPRKWPSNLWWRSRGIERWQSDESRAARCPSRH